MVIGSGISKENSRDISNSLGDRDCIGSNSTNSDNSNLNKKSLSVKIYANG
ncbi:hypothetical protein DDB_G0288337 [Dictyostelium discoideum AX4]|uniref:hypothetical protein n=1 Tax=Dictyostelium discoideum AX4 TaxID=352472 RepID=UPI00004E2E4D|nr:hypothetical protein DDB_G0288337 [Dictyostelium discoideum AX4]EAL63265.1 hypothetical protein DDB_G0288337 [Dictyostelium discoideum AX4]|eukprot:XP_636769.1 hypothetical protein DDB_G0288337 [Dictyostelium discoideum AX4]